LCIFDLVSALLRDPGLRGKLLFTVLAVVLFRIGQSVPVPGVDVRALHDATETAVRDDPAYGLADLLTGGGLLRLAFCGLGPYPLVAATAVVQFLAQTSPRVKALAAEGTAGRAVLERYARNLSVVLGAVMGAGAGAAAVHERLPGGDVLTS